MVIPQGKEEEVLKIAEEIDRKEQEILKLVLAGYSLKEARSMTGYHHLQTKEQ